MRGRTENTSFWKLVRTRNFGLLWGSGGLSAIGDQFDLLAFPWLVLMLTGDPLAVGIVMAVGLVPSIFFLVIGGAMVDRYSPRLMMIASNVTRMVLVSTLSAMILASWTDLYVIYVFAFLKGTADSFYYPAQMAMLPRIVPVDLLRQSNAVVHTTRDLSGFVGPSLAGILIAAFSNGLAPIGDGEHTGIAVAFAVVALTMLVSSLMILLMRMGDAGKDESGDGQEEPGMLQSIAVGIRHVRSDSAMFAFFLLSIGVELLIMGPVIVGIPVLAETRLAEGALALGVISSAYAGGSLLGATSAGALRPPDRGLGPILVIAMAVSGLLIMPFGVLRSMWLAAALALLAGLAGGYVEIIFVSWIQGRTPPAMLGRIMSLLLVSTVGMYPVSVAVSGALIKLSLKWVFIGSGGLMALFSIVIGSRTEIRQMQMPSGQED